MSAGWKLKTKAPRGKAVVILASTANNFKKIVQHVHIRTSDFNFLHKVGKNHCEPLRMNSLQRPGDHKVIF
jgi:hypothetical protein